MGAARTAAVLLAALAAGCGGGGGDGNRIATSPFRSPPAAENFRAGPYAIDGIRLIPDSMVKLSKAEMRQRWVIAERVLDHADTMGRIACRSYVIDTSVTDCERENRPGIQRNADDTIVRRTTGSTPFTEFLDVKSNFPDSGGHAWVRDQINAITPQVRIVNASESYFLMDLGIGQNDNWLTVHSTSNAGENDPLFELAEFTSLPASDQDRIKQGIAAALAANRLILVSGWKKDEVGNYIRHPLSASCKDVDSGCLWAPFVLPGRSEGEYPGLGGSVATSGAAVQVSAALASVLAVFPNTSPENLAKFAKACARKSGNGIEELLQNSGGTGVADFNCMGSVVAALRSLPAGGRTTAAIGGRTVSFGRRDLTVSFAQSLSARHFGGGTERSGWDFLFQVVPNGENAAMAFASLRKSGFFTSFGMGTYDSFFGFRQGHGDIFGMEYALGHEALFVHMTDVRSARGELISYAEGGNRSD